MRRLSTIALLCVAFGCAGVTPTLAPAPAPEPAPAAPTATLSVEDVVRLQEVSTVAIDPAGQRVAYALRTPRGIDEGPGSAHNVIWVVDRKSNEARRYTPNSFASWAPAWSPDAAWLTFISRRNDDSSSQVYRISPDGGEPERLTDTEGNVHAFAWSPDGTKIAYLADRVPTTEESQVHADGRDWRVGDVEGTYRRLWVLEVATGKTYAITDRAVHVSQFRWSPNGTNFAVVASDRADVDATMMYSRLSTVAARGGALQPLTETEGKLGAVDWSPDGGSVAFLGASDLHDPTAGVLYVVSAGGGPARPLTAAYEGTGQWVRWVTPDTIVMVADEGTRAVVFGVDPRSGEHMPLFQGGPACHASDVGSDGQTFACAGSTPRHPREVFTGTLGGELRRHTDSNPWLANKRLGEQEVVRWKAPDGLEIEGVVVKPVGYAAGKRYPLAVLVHGGPEGVSLHDWNTRSGYPAQLFATRGYMVLEPNYRGSHGRGVAFGKADQEDLGGKEIEDVLAGIDHLVAQGLVDAERVGMGGWSYGGYLSGLAATKYSDRFKAAMVGAAITDWISFTGTTEIEHENSLVHWNLWPWDNFELAWARSPVAHAKHSKTPTLIVHGAADSRVPPEQATELYRALRHFGVKTDLVVYPRAGHGLSEEAHQIDFVTRFLDWFDRHIQ